MRIPFGSLLLSAVPALALALAPTLATGTPPLALLRMPSLDRALRDAKTLAEAGGVRANPEQAVEKALELLGGIELAQLDRQRPLVVSLPAEGMALKTQGLVALLPVKSPAGALEALARQSASRSRQGSLHTFSMLDGSALFARIHESYLVVGRSRDLVLGFDAKSALLWSGPPGFLQWEVHLEPVAPLLQSGLIMAKDSLRQRLDAGDGPGGVSGAGLEPVVDLYMDLLRDLLNNVSRLQVTLELDAGGHAHYRQKFVPKAGSTLALFLRDQKGGLPDIARLVEPGAVVMAGKVALTPQIRVLLKDLSKRYLSAMETLLQTLAKSGGEGQEGFAAQRDFWTAYLAATGELSDRLVDCARGDFAAAFDLGDGFSFVEVFGHNGGKACQNLVRDGAAKIREVLAKAPEEAGGITITEETVSGPLKAQTVRIASGALLGRDPDPDAAEALQKLFGKDGITFQMAALDDLFLYTGGSGGGTLLRRTAANRSRKGSPGIKAELFRPLAPRPGLLGAVDLGRALGQLRAQLPAEARDQGLADAAAAFKGPAGRVRFALGLEPSGAEIQLAVPVETLRAARALSARSKAAEPEPPEDSVGGPQEGPGRQAESPPR